MKGDFYENLLGGLLLVTLLLPVSLTANASNTTEKETLSNLNPAIETMTFIDVDGVQTVVPADENGNFISEETGEYFIWTNPTAKTVVKDFFYKIKYSVESSSFELGSTEMKIKAYNAHLADYVNQEDDYDVDFRFAIDVWPKTALCNVNRGTQSASFTGLSSTKLYTVRIRTLDDPFAITGNDYTYLNGEGSIDNLE